MTPEISIITVGYRSEKTIGQFLDSIKKERDKIQKEIIVIDNFPADKCAEIARKHPLKPRVIQNQENIGFSRAVNQGLKLAKGKYILLNNLDCKIVGSSIKYLLDFAKEHPNLGAVAPRLLNYDGSVQPSCSRFPTIWNAIKYNFFGVKNAFKKYNPGNKTTKVEVAVMASMLIPRSVFAEVGNLDERFFLYYEDVEFCRRLYRHNLPVYYLPKAKVQHMHGASGNFTSHLQSPLLKSAQIYYGKPYSAALNIVLWLGHKWQVILRGKRFRD